MTSDYEAMCRILFAILRQKNLKDIDWEQVARDPVLIEPISNGHAARMRYSRYRTSVTGHKPKRRSSGAKSRVSKSSSSSRRDSHVKKETIVKSEPGVSLAFPQYTPDVSPHMGDLGDDFENPRFLTPCSDDMNQPLCVRPSAMHQIPQHFDYGLDLSPDFKQEAPEGSPDISAFEADYSMGNFSSGTALLDLASQPTDLNTSEHLWANQFRDGLF